VRVVSLLPAATEIVAALGMADALVGVTHECDFPAAAAARPRVTRSAIDVEAEAAAVDAQVRALSAAGAPLFGLLEAEIARAAPTVILTQALCDVCAVSETDVRALAARLALAPAVVTLSASTLDGVLDDVERVAAALGVSDRGRALVESLRARMRQVHEALRAARAPRPRVAVIEWTSPAYAAGHWVPDMVRRAGGIDVLGTSGEHSRPRSIDEIRNAEAEVIVFAPCGYDAARAAAEMATRLARDEWAWARDRRCVAADANAHVSRPGPRLVDGIEWMATVFNPGVV
jgi:iron complex transport system substrate-binding protein